MNDFRYILEKTTRKITCPGCGKKTFVRYVDAGKEIHLPEQYGRCDREVNCAYWLNPYKDGCSKMIFEQERTGNSSDFNPTRYRPQPKPEPKRVSLIDRSILDKSLSAYEANNFVNYLLTLFPVEIVEVLISKYLIGTHECWKGSTVFWQVSTKGEIKAGKVMLYNPITGKRVKEPYNHITWVHSALKLNDYNLQQCLFGEHLLNENKESHIAIVESEKTAVIASVYLPEFIWLACGSLSNLKEDKCKVLSGRNVVLYPDLNGFNKWSEKAKLLSGITNFEVSDLLEQNATEEERANGLDLADYLIQFDHKEFTPQPVENLSKPIIFSEEVKERESDTHPPLLTVEKPSRMVDNLTITPPTELWDIESIESFFNGIDIPGHPIKLNKETTIENVELFIKSHISEVKKNNGKRTYKPYFDRLQALKNILSN